jgi:hypothetical protein
MAAVVEIAQAMPAVVRLFSVLRTGSIARGKIIPVSNISPMNETEAIRRLQQKIKTKKKTDFNDGRYVVKVSDVVEIVERILSEGNICSKVAVKMAIALITTDPGDPVLLDPAQKIIDEVRGKVLRQDTPRVRQSVRYAKRPAR